MIRALVTLAAIGLLNACAALREPEEQAYLAVSTVDMGQTWDLANSQCYHEQNPLLGIHPSHAKTVGYFVGTDVLHVGVSDYLLTHDHPVLFHIWESIGISGEGFVVGINVSHGLKPYSNDPYTGCRS